MSDDQTAQVAPSLNDPRTSDPRRIDKNATNTVQFSWTPDANTPDEPAPWFNIRWVANLTGFSSAAPDGNDATATGGLQGTITMGYYRYYTPSIYVTKSSTPQDPHPAELTAHSPPTRILDMSSTSEPPTADGTFSVETVFGLYGGAFASASTGSSSRAHTDGTNRLVVSVENNETPADPGP